MCRPVAFRPQHEAKLANEFLLYTDADDVAADLGGWDASFGEPEQAPTGDQSRELTSNGASVPLPVPPRDSAVGLDVQAVQAESVQV